MKAMNYQDDIPSLPNDNVKHHFVVVFDLTPMKDDTENCHQPDLVGEPKRLELIFTFHIQHVTEFTVMGNESLWLQLTSLLSSERQSEIDDVSFQRIISSIPLLKFRHSDSVFSGYVPSLDKDAFAFINTQPVNMQGDHWIIIANSRQFCILQIFSVVQSTIFSRSNMNRWYQNHLSPTPPIMVSTQVMQLFISSICGKKKLLDMTILMYFHSKILKIKFHYLYCNCAGYTMCLVIFFKSN